MAAPVHVAAIDAGSNAIRLIIARATSPNHIRELETVRAAVRLGHNAFTRRRLDRDTIARAGRVFRQFRKRMDRFGVTAYRAVATSAAREARNHRVLLERIRRKSGLELEIISGTEEARLVRVAVLAMLGSSASPRLILDLGGGSLELSFLRDGVLEHSIGLPLGAVRLMETLGIEGAISEELAARLRHHVLSVLRSAVPVRPNLSAALAVACGGNAESLARLAPGPGLRGLPTLNLRLLRERLWQLLRLDVRGRMNAFGVRQDRAEVIGVAAIVLATLGRWLNLRAMLVPGVGVREGVLFDLVAAQYSSAPATVKEQQYARTLLAGARWFARRLDVDAKHVEQVRTLAVGLFDQLRPLHRLGPELRLLLELGAVLHDVGHFVNRESHHRHGEYLVRNSEIPGLRGWRRDMVACLARYHNSQSDPQPGHKSYASLDGPRRRQVRLLTSLLRIAEQLDSGHRQAVHSLSIEIEGRRAVFRLQTQDGARLDLAKILRAAGLLEREFHLRVAFKRAQLKEKVA